MFDANVPAVDKVDNVEDNNKGEVVAKIAVEATIEDSEEVAALSEDSGAAEHTMGPEEEPIVRPTYLKPILAK